MRFVVALLIALIIPAAALAWTTQGGHTMAPNVYGIEVSGGFPDVQLAVYVPVQRHLEVAPFATFHYFGPITKEEVRLGNSFGTRVKLNVVDRGRFQMSLLARPSFYVSYKPDIKVGIQASIPELVMGYDVMSRLHLHWGTRFSPTFLFTTDYRVSVHLPLLFHLGLEGRVAKNVNIFTTFEAGPIWGFGPGFDSCTPAPEQGMVQCNKLSRAPSLDAIFRAMVGFVFVFGKGLN
ncbi:MAG: hypothetical protein ACOX51_07495 [Myxococcota bacterium]|jgi:hypothetical protein|nr:hypothetical protein [Myxococcota bacterium]